MVRSTLDERQRMACRQTQGEYYPTWALFFSKYVDAYTAEGIDLWGFTVENEPHGNGGNWESMHYSPEERFDS